MRSSVPWRSATGLLDLRITRRPSGRRDYEGGFTRMSSGMGPFSNCRIRGFADRKIVEDSRDYKFGGGRDTRVPQNLPIDESPNLRIPQTPALPPGCAAAPARHRACDRTPHATIPSLSPRGGHARVRVDVGGGRGGTAA